MLQLYAPAPRQPLCPRAIPSPPRPARDVPRAARHLTAHLLHIPPRMSAGRVCRCGEVKKKINAFLLEGSVTKGRFCREIGVQATQLDSFLKMAKAGAASVSVHSQPGGANQTYVCAPARSCQWGKRMAGIGVASHAPRAQRRPSSRRQRMYLTPMLFGGGCLAAFGLGRYWKAYR